MSPSTGEIEQLIRTHAEARGVTTAKIHSIVPLCFLLSPDVPPPADATLRVRWMLGVARRLGLVPWPDGEMKAAPPKEVNFYRTRAWRVLRYRAIKKYGNRCMCCGRIADPIHVDHIKPRSKYPELALDINNLQILDDDCNLGKGAWDSTDWRPSSGSSTAHPHALSAPDSPEQKYPGT